MSADKQGKYKVGCPWIRKCGHIKNVEKRVRDDLINKINNYIDNNLIPRCKSDEGYDIGWRTSLTTLKIMLKELD